jgi:putative transposase
MQERKAKRYRYPLDLISIAVWSYYRFNDSYRDVSERLLYRGIDVSYEAIRQWCIKFGAQFKNVIQKRAPKRSDKWQKRRTKKAVIRFLSRLLNAHPKPRLIVTD